MILTLCYDTGFYTGGAYDSGAENMENGQRLFPSQQVYEGSAAYR